MRSWVNVSGATRASDFSCTCGPAEYRPRRARHASGSRARDSARINSRHSSASYAHDTFADLWGKFICESRIPANNASTPVMPLPVAPPHCAEVPGATVAPATDAPATDAPGTDVPATDAPGTDAPGANDAPAPPGAPGTDAPGANDAPAPPAQASGE